MRQLTNHHVAFSPPPVVVKAADESGLGKACHRYRLSGFALDTDPQAGNDDVTALRREELVVLLQNGPVGPNGEHNGVTMESLLAVGIDRLRGQQTGPTATAETAGALEYLRLAMRCLHERERRCQAEVNEYQAKH